MSHPNKIRGTRWESELVEYLARVTGWPVERKALHGNQDQGDLTGIPGWSFEAKNAKEIRLGDYVDEIRVEQRHANALYGAVLVKRRGKGPAGAYVLLPMEVLLKLLPRPLKSP